MIKIIKTEVDKQTETIILDYIRKNIYKNYPARSLKKSSLWDKISIHCELKYKEISAGNSQLTFYEEVSYDYYFVFDRQEICKFEHEPQIRVYIK